MNQIPQELLVGAIIAIWGALGTVIAYLYKDIRALNAQMVEFFKAQAKEAEAKAEWYARRDALAPRRPQDSYENLKE